MFRHQMRKADVMSRPMELWNISNCFIIVNDWVGEHNSN